MGREIRPTDGLAMPRKTKGSLGYRFKGRRYDAGDEPGYLEANIAHALERPEMREGLLAWMQEVVRTGQP
jgi:UTP--glucose-1-phosphate uridylyltransferase